MESKTEKTKSSNLSELRDNLVGCLGLLTSIPALAGLFFRSAIFTYLKIQPGILQTVITIIMVILGVVGALTLLVVAGAVIYAGVSALKQPSVKIAVGCVACFVLILGLLLPVWGHWDWFEQAARDVLVISVFLWMIAIFLLFGSMKPKYGTGGIGTSYYDAKDMGKAGSTTALIFVALVLIYPILFLIRLYWLFLLTR